MDIFKQIIDQRISKIMTDNPDFYKEDDDNRRKSKAFLLLGVASYLDIDIAEAIQYITDGRGDGGFDAAYIMLYCFSLSIQEIWKKIQTFRQMRLRKL